MEFEKEQILKRLTDSGLYETHNCTSDEIQRQTFRIWVRKLLWDRSILVEFEKADKTIRIMECTLSEKHGAKYKPIELNPNELFPKEAPAKKKNDEICSVWDVRNSSWKSFRWDRLKKIDYKVD
jgi:hypothetical protein